MNLLGRRLVCLYAIAWCFLALPSFADDPTSPAADKPSEAATSKSPESKATTTDSDTRADSAKAESGESKETESLTTQSMMDALKDPTKRMTAMGNLAELLGVASALMLVTGSSLAFCLNRYKLLGLMVAVGIAGGVAALAAPGVIHMAGSEGLAVAVVLFNLIFYLAVFFLPTILAFKDNTAKKVKIAIINAAGFIVPGAGLVALYVALKDKSLDATAAQPTNDNRPTI